MKKICAILLNWKGAEDTIDCLQSFLSQSITDGLHIIVIDNASPDDSVNRILSWANSNEIALEIQDYISAREKLLRTGFTTQSEGIQLTVVRSDANIGFCAGNNLGAQIGFDAGADYALVLNNDTVVPTDFNAKLQKEMADDNGTTLYSPQIAYAAEPETIWWCGGRFSRLLSPTYLGQGDPIQVTKFFDPATQWVSGCATLISRNLYSQLGLYDPVFFIWCEEWDLSLRAASADVPMRILPSVIVYHKVGKSLGITSPLTFFYAMRNMMILRKRYISWFLRFPFNMVYMPYKLSQALRLTISQRDQRYLLGYLDALISTRLGGKWRRQN